MSVNTLSRKNFRILVVDDFSTMRRIVKGLLTELGFRDFEEAEDGRDALQKLIEAHGSGKPFDFIVLDVNMPNMNGFELLRVLKKDENETRFRDVPVLFITAEARKEDIVLAAQNGASGYIVKPFTKTILEEKIKSIFAKRGCVFA